MKDIFVIIYSRYYVDLTKFFLFYHRVVLDYDKIEVIFETAYGEVFGFSFILKK